MIIQLSPSIPVITPKGKAQAIAMIDYGPEHNLHWICFQDSNGECWTWQNPDIRAQRNITMGRTYISPFYDPHSVKLNCESEKNIMLGVEEYERRTCE